MGAKLLSDYELSTEQEYSAMTDNADTLKLIRKDNQTHSPRYNISEDKQTLYDLDTAGVDV